MQIASDYEAYEANKTVIDALIEANPTSDFAAGWVAELAIAASMGYGRVGGGRNLGRCAGCRGAQKILIGGGSDGSGDTNTFNAGDGAVTILNGVSKRRIAKRAGVLRHYGYSAGKDKRQMTIALKCAA